MNWRVWLAAAVLSGSAAAQPVSIDYVRIDIPEGWVRNDETRFASYSPADDSDIVLIVATRLGDEGADDVLEDFVAHVEGEESAVERGDAEEVSDDDFNVLKQTTRTRAKDGTEMRRLYVSADPGDQDTILAYGGTAEAFARHEAQGVPAVLGAAYDAKAMMAGAVPEQPGDGGLDGAFVAERQRVFLDAVSGRWRTGTRSDMLVFDPLGEVYRGAPASFGAEIFDQCDGAAAWRCGRYRLEDGAIAIRWRDGTGERRSLYQAPAGLSLDGVIYRRSDATGQNPPAKGYVYQDIFNAGDWPLTVPKSEGAPLRVRFLEDGRFLFEGFTSIRNPRFGNGLSGGGRYKIDGRAITLVYEQGGSDVVGYTRWQGDDADIIVIGGHAFAGPPD